jgi:hypothetical protein
MNKKAVSPITLIYMDFVFVIIWVFFLANHFTFYGQQAIANGAGGLAAFFYANINMFVMFGLIAFNFLGLIADG